MRPSIFFLSLFFQVLSVHSQTVCGSMIGVNMSGAEYSWENFPNDSDLDYLKSKGVSLIRLPISWEKFQPDLNVPLDANQISGIKHF
ncbi:MAG: hypothetical protein HYU69_13700 [Bacteroidetes bacterium]|nr:hypothetical protein [Bacteroidota bacterium]